MRFSTTSLLLILTAATQASLLNLLPLAEVGLAPGPQPAAISVTGLVGVLGPAKCGLRNGLLDVEVLVDIPGLLSVCLCVDVLASLTPGQSSCPQCNHGKPSCITDSKKGGACGCICDPGWTLCNGKCTKPPSQAARQARSVAAIGASFWSSAEMCPTNETACRLPSGGYECINTAFTLDSCGGCPGSRNFQNCLAIPGALSVTCRDSDCEVHSCFPGCTYRAGRCHRDH